MTFILYFFFAFGLVTWLGAAIEAIRWWKHFRQMRISLGSDWEQVRDHLKYLMVLSKATAGRTEARANGTMN